MNRSGSRREAGLGVEAAERPPVEGEAGTRTGVLPGLEAGPDGPGAAKRKRLWFWAGPAVGLALGFGMWMGGLPREAMLCGAITGWCAVWWLTEPVSIPATSILTMALFSLTGVLEHGQVANAIGHPLVILMMGGFMLSKAMESSGAHRLVAMRMVQLAGGASEKRLVLGFMLASASLSMWISNTATTLMLLPAALAVVERAPDRRIAVPLLLGVAYAASIGGVATPIGTPPNIIFLGVYEQQTGVAIGFMEWMKVGVPVALILLPLAWLWLTRSLRHDGVEGVRIEPERHPAQRRVLIVFGLTALAWMTRTEPFGGWSGFLGLEGAGDSTVALLAVGLLFILPSGGKEGGRLLTWSQASRIPWGVLLLFGAGISIATAFQSSGLSEIVAEMMTGLATWPVVLVIVGICVTVTLLTEVTSNTATATLLMPLLAAAALASEIPPALLMVPAALSASCAFMLPVATPPNAVVFGSQRIRVAEMAREGTVLNVVGAMTVSLVCWVLLGQLGLFDL